MPAYPQRIELLAQTIARYSGYSEPDSPLYHARNPGGLKATSMRHARNEHGQRVFSSFIDGFQALMFDLDTKLSGRSWTGISEDSTLEELAAAYSLEFTVADAWARFIRKALDVSSINRKTTLGALKKDKD